MNQTARTTIYDGVALSLGLINAITDDAALREDAIAFARRIADRGEAPLRIRNRTQANSLFEQLDKGIALRASDINIVAVPGYNYPVYRGGTLCWADQVGLARVVAEMRDLERAYGKTFHSVPMPVRLAEQGRQFGDRL